MSPGINVETEVMTILVEIRDHHSFLASTNTTSSVSTTTMPESDMTYFTSIRERLLNIATPQETMNLIIPYLFQNPDTRTDIYSNDSTSCVARALSSTDALQILGFLVSSHIDVVTKENQKPQYLIAASKVIQQTLQEHLCSRTRDIVHTTTTPSSEEESNSFYMSNELSHVLIHQACTGLDIEVSQNCHDSILSVFQSSAVVETSIVSSFILEEIVSVWSSAITTVLDSKNNTKQVRSEYGTICVRCTALIVDIIVLNDDHTMQMLFGRMDSSVNTNVRNILGTLLTDLTDDDPLLQISIYDILYKLASTRPYHVIRSHLLLNDSFLQPLLRKVGVGSSEDEPDLYLGSSALRILIAICSMLNDSTVTNNNEVATTIGDSLIRDLHAALRNFEISGSSEMERLSYIDAISSLAITSTTAMNMILNDPITSRGWLSLAVAQPTIKAAILGSIANVIDHPDSVIPNGFSTSTPPLSSTTVTNEISMKLYSALGQINSISSGSNHSDTTEILLKLVQSPIPEIRYGVYRLMEAIAKYSSGGQVLMTNTNFFTDFLMPRNETTYDGCVLKYHLVQALYDNATLKQLLSNEIVIQLEKYISQGPHYKKAMQWDVMTMEQ